MLKKENRNNILILALSFAFFLFFCFYDGVIWCDDSLSYVQNIGTREPFYPFLISILKNIFKDEIYLQVLVLIQSLLMAYATYSISAYVIKEYDIKDYYQFIPFILIISVSLMCRFIANRSSMYSNCVLTEGIAYPLFLIFFKYLLFFINENKNKYLLICTILSLILVSTRKQMFLSLMLIIVSLIFNIFHYKKIKENILKILLILLLVFGGYKAFDSISMAMNGNVNITHTGDNRFIAAMVIYSSEREDAELIEDTNLRRLYLDIYNECDENEYLKKYETGNFYNKFCHYSDTFDHVQIDIMMEKVNEYVNSNYDLNNYEANVMVDKINSVFIKSLLPNTFFKILNTSFNNFLSGLFIAISADREIFIIYSILAYTLYIFVLIKLSKINEFNKYSFLGVIVIISIILNDLIISIGVFNQTRYTIYNMALFYIALFVMSYKLICYKCKMINCLK